MVKEGRVRAKRPISGLKKARLREVGNKKATTTTFNFFYKQLGILKSHFLAERR